MKISPRLALVIIASLFALPLVLAWLLYSGTIEYRPVETRNFGMLVQPPAPMLIEDFEKDDRVSVRRDELREHWVVVYVAPDPCSERCLQDVTALRQVHRAAGGASDVITEGVRFLSEGVVDHRQFHGLRSALQELLQFVYPALPHTYRADGRQNTVAHLQ